MRSMTNSNKLQSAVNQISILSQLSPATRLKVGAALCDDEFNILALGYNHPIVNAPCEIMNEETGELETDNRRMLHAEESIIALCSQQRISLKGKTIILTHSPCSQCAKMLAACGIKKILFKELYRNTDSFEVLDEAEVEYHQI